MGSSLYFVPIAYLKFKSWVDSTIREWAVSTEAIHLASAIEFGKAGHIDAEFLVKRLAEDPERIGKYLRDALKRIDEEHQPKMPVEKCLATYYYKNLSGS